MLGCSYTHGTGLAEEEIFSSILANYTNRTIYNLGIGGKGPRTMLYILRYDFPFIKKFLLKDNTQAEYIIYTYINDHKRRLYVDLNPESVPYYKIIKSSSEKHLELRKNIFIEKTYLYKNLMELVYKYKIDNHPKEVFELFCLYIKEINNEIKSKFYTKNKPTKFVIFVYEEDGTEDWDKVRDEGIIVIRAKDILDINLDDSEYRLLEGHPNAKAWEAIVPALARELNL